MSKFTLLTQRNPHPATVPLFCQDGFFFNDEHLYQQSSYPLYVITAVNQTTQRADARCSFFVKAEGAVSPGAAPFGSVEFANTLPDAVLRQVLTAMVEQAKSAGSLTLRIVNYPHCYAPEQAERLTRLLSRHGFVVKANHPTFFLSVTDEPFRANLDPSERRRLQKCQRADFRFEHWPDPDLGVVTSFLTETRRQQGYHLSIPAEPLTDLMQRFPDRFGVFVVNDGPTVIALTITVRIRHDILYNFLPASRPDYHGFSPMVMLTDGLFTYCRREGIRLLDLGLSLDGDRQPKPSLMRFKRNLGARESPKLVFEKLL